MTNDKLITVLEEIRDQQKQQIANFEQALQTTSEAQTIQQRGQRVLWILIVAPWAFALMMLVVLLVRG